MAFAEDIETWKKEHQGKIYSVIMKHDLRELGASALVVVPLPDLMVPGIDSGSLSEHRDSSVQPDDAGAFERHVKEIESRGMKVEVHRKIDTPSRQLPLLLKEFIEKSRQ